MGDLYAVSRLVPYVYTFLAEQLTRAVSRDWPNTYGTVTGGTIEGVGFPYTATLRYEYRVEGTLFFGCLQRRCFRQRSAERIARLDPGSPVHVRYQPASPERSYVPLPLGWGGFAVAGLPVFGFAAFLIFLTVAMVQDHYIEARDAIPASEWRQLEVQRLFRVEMPGAAVPYPSPPIDLKVAGTDPAVTGWMIERGGSYFYAGYLEYPLPVTLGYDVLDRVLDSIKQQNPKRYVYGDQPLTLQTRTGREFEFTRPYTTMRVFVAGQRIFFVATTWYVGSDVRKFVGSFRFD